MEEASAAALLLLLLLLVRTEERKRAGEQTERGLNFLSPFLAFFLLPALFSFPFCNSHVSPREEGVAEEDKKRKKNKEFSVAHAPRPPPTKNVLLPPLSLSPSLVSRATAASSKRDSLSTPLPCVHSISSSLSLSVLFT